MLYAFDAQDVGRIRRLLAAYEQGRLLTDTPPAIYPSQAGRQDTILGHVTAAIPAATVVGSVTTAGTGTAVMVLVDYSTGSPVLTDLTNTDKVYTVANYQTSSLPAGYYLLAREPTSGNYVPAALNPAAWYSGASLTAGTYPTTSTPIPITGMTLTLPYVGDYYISAWFSGTLSFPTSLTLPVDPILSASIPLLAGGVCTVASLGANATASPTNLECGGTGSLVGVYHNTTAGTVISCETSVQNLPVGGTAEVAAGELVASLFSTGAVPSATTVNGLTGGVNVAPASGGGTVVTTSGTTIAVGLSSAALAAINQYLAGFNL